MKARTFFATLALMLVTIGCTDMGNPESVARQADEAIRPYFPNVRTRVFPDEGIIVAFTCSLGTGSQLSRTVAEMLPNIKEFSSLKTLRNWGGIFGSHTYGIVALGFEDSMVTYNIDTGESKMGTSLGQKYIADYKSECGLSESRTGGYAMLGTWRVEFTLNDVPQTTTWWDTLGEFDKSERFAQNPSPEVTAREGIIRSYMAARNWKDIKLTLVSVKAVPIPSRYLEQVH
ncbi:MAG: hypothetical protein CXZ00_03065 [Acidobacteria bacterium]|nr:MAG: hypothetical protein CXZ00_03065 [Acidobacteriota bacterium]